MEVQQLVGIVPWTFVATILNLFLQIYLMKRFLFKPIHGVLEKRKSLADAAIHQAELAKTEAQAIKSEYEINMLEAKKKANEILSAAKRTAAMQSEEMLREASKQTVAMKVKAEHDIAQEKKKVMNEIKHEIGDMAMEIAGKVIGREICEDDHKKLIEEFITNVGEEA